MKSADKFRFTHYESPLVNRYASEAMLYNFSLEKRYVTWREIWIALAEAERALGLPISRVQIAQMKRFAYRINYDRARYYEQKFKHEVVAHLHAFGEQCPRAKPIIHLGATSALVMDNADLIIIRNGLKLIKQKLVNVIGVLSNFARRYANQPTLGFTHFQPALITTVGKRVTLWLADLLMDLHNIESAETKIKALGAKGAIGTQASFLTLFNHNARNVQRFDQLFSRKLGFSKSYPVTGQTYPRKVDYEIISILSGIAQSAHKFSNDLRLLQGLGEMEEPFGKEQVGSSAMAYKRNPIGAERMASLARFVITTGTNTALTAAYQWLERTMDDSANRRLVIPETFLATDALLNIYLYITSNLKVYQTVIQRHIETELPFLATEEIIMDGVKRGRLNRQVLHQRIRDLSMMTVAQIKQGRPNDLWERMVNDPVLGKCAEAVRRRMKITDYTGLAAQQTTKFLTQSVRPILKKYRSQLGLKSKLSV